MRKSNKKEDRKSIYCFGNPLLKEDRFPFLLLPQLRNYFPDIDFIAAESPDEIEEKREICIIDTAKGIKKVEVLSEIDDLCSNKNCSLHDFDLGMSLKLMKKIGKLKKIRIFAIPMGYRKRKALVELKEKITNEIY